MNYMYELIMPMFLAKQKDIQLYEKRADMHDIVVVREQNEFPTLLQQTQEMFGDTSNAPDILKNFEVDDDVSGMVADKLEKFNNSHS